MYPVLFVSNKGFQLGEFYCHLMYLNLIVLYARKRILEELAQMDDAPDGEKKAEAGACCQI